MGFLPKAKRGALRAYHVGYVAALTLIGLFSFGAVRTAEQVIQKQEGAGRIINVAGRQRMLSQRIALLARPGGRPEPLAAALSLMGTAHAELLRLGPDDEVTQLLSPAAVGRAEQLRPEVDAFLAAGRAGAADLPRRAEALLPQLDRFVKDLETGAAEELSELSRLEGHIFLATLCLLLLEALLLFRPLTRRLGAALAAAETARTHAEARRRLTARILDQMDDAIALVDAEGRLGEVASRRFHDLFPDTGPGASVAEPLDLESLSRPGEHIGTQVLTRGLQTLELEIAPFEGDEGRSFLLYVRDVTEVQERAFCRDQEAKAILDILGDDPQVHAVAQEELSALAREAASVPSERRRETLAKLESTARALGFEELAASTRRADRYADDDEAYDIALEELVELESLFADLTSGVRRPR